jgi:phosphatidylserine/phosphatidylglycerophosphate/cardiolipin synthase-like enzyme
MAAVFSPRANLDALDWYGKLAGSAKKRPIHDLCVRHERHLPPGVRTDDSVLRFGLMEKERNGKGKDARSRRSGSFRRGNVVIAIDNRISLNNFDQWLKQLDRVTPDENVQWVHLKFMVVDPPSDHPLVVTGSANFSEASTKTNDENMLVIKDNTRIADIYLGEYMRLYSHYAFREVVKIFLDKNPGAKPEDMKQGFLIEDRDWTAPYFDPGDSSARMARRLYFAG